MLMDGSWKSVLESGQQRDVILKVFVIQTGSLSDDWLATMVLLGRQAGAFGRLWGFQMIENW